VRTGWDGTEGRWGLKIAAVAQGEEMVTNGWENRERGRKERTGRKEP